MKAIFGIAFAAALAFAGHDAAAQGLKRLYVFDCGRQVAKDQSRWTPEIGVGQSVEFSNNCYLLQHEKGTLLWETGLPDSLLARPEGVVTANGSLTMFREKGLIAQIESLGVKLEDITFVAVSHSHGDHIGNLKLFPKSKVLMQKAEHEVAVKIIPNPFAEGQNIVMLEGDVDVFADGSVTIVSTPGHTPGHQSLLVKLPKTGALILTGDLVHFQVSWDKKLVPPFNFNKEQSLASIARVQMLLEQNKAQLWIGHDKDNTAKVERAPKFYE
jgi:N-acyl homoserine lactone hydrolase